MQGYFAVERAISRSRSRYRSFLKAEDWERRNTTYKVGIGRVGVLASKQSTLDVYYQVSNGQMGQSKVRNGWDVLGLSHRHPLRLSRLSRNSPQLTLQKSAMSQRAYA